MPLTLIYEAFSDNELPQLYQLAQSLSDGQKAELRFYLLNPLSQERLDALNAFLSSRISLINVVEETEVTPSSVRIQFHHDPQTLPTLASLLNQEEFKKSLLGFALFRA